MDVFRQLPVLRVVPILFVGLTACQNETVFSSEPLKGPIENVRPSDSPSSEPTVEPSSSTLPEPEPTSTGVIVEPSPVQSPVPSGTPVTTPTPTPEPSPSSSSAPSIATVKVVLSQPETLRTFKKDILEIVGTLPTGTELIIPRDAPPGNFKYRLSNGNTQTSSNYFYAGIHIKHLPGADKRGGIIDDYHALPGGLFLPSTIADDVQEPVIFPLIPGEAQVDYLKTYSKAGKPNFQFSSYFKTRFGSALNKEVNFSQLPVAQQLKWNAIYGELRRFASRSEFVDAERLFIPLAEATAASIAYEKIGKVATLGAWSIAVKATAPRHGFGNVPCAEFVSEVVRQSYARAGYSHAEDFNATKGNPLIWNKSAAVVDLANHLAKAGWIPWESYYYQPPAGAPVMNYKATTPGHAYLSAIDGGQFIVDNGAPRGRDLRTTPDKYIRMMYMHGVFFLPPGIKPARWP